MSSVLPIFLLFSYINAELNKSLMLNYLEYKFCATAIIFNCDTKRDRVDLVKFFSQNNLRISIYDVGGLNLSLSTAFIRDQSNLAVVVDGDCERTETFLQNCGQMDFFFHTYHWLMLGSKRGIINKFDNVNLFINADVSVAILNKKKSNWTIFDVYNPAYRKGGRLVVNRIGSHTDEDGYQLQVKDNKYYTRRNMTGTLFKSTTVIPESISISLDEYLASDVDRKNNSFARYQNVINKNCKDFFQFDVNMSSMSSWGYLLPNGDVDGMAKELKEKRIDYGNTPLLFKPYRLKVMDYGYGSWIMKTTFFFRHPKNTASSFEIYLQPLETNVWIAIFCIMALIIVIFRIALVHEENVLSETTGDSTWAFLIMYTIGELGQQGFAYLPTIASTRIVLLTISIFFFMVYQFYSCSIVSNLLLEPPRTINTLHDLLESKLEAGCENILYAKDYFATTKDPVAVQLYNKKIIGPRNTTNFLQAAVGMRKVKAGGFAFHIETSTAYPIIETEFSEDEICELSEVKMYANQRLYIPLPKGSPLKEMFDYCSIHQLEVGVVHRLSQYWGARKPECRDKTQYLKIEVGLDEFYWALIVLGVGLVFGLFLLLIEYGWKRWGLVYCTKGKLMKRLFNKLYT